MGWGIVLKLSLPIQQFVLHSSEKLTTLISINSKLSAEDSTFRNVFWAKILEAFAELALRNLKILFDCSLLLLSNKRMIYIDNN